MERKLKIYLETTIPNFVYADDAPEERDITKRFFDILKLHKFEVFTSDAVIVEINRTRNESHRNNLLRALDGIERLPVSAPCEELAREYIHHKIIPAKFEPDALRVAIATLNNLDVVVTWNMEHLANPKARIAIRELNERKNFKAIDIATPEEVIESV
ncbi:MAG: hypothetical protein HYT97_03165 [Elusimicrobia bacterium]|nr:hypothetical protein [Elusimicrobiota bacterium]